MCSTPFGIKARITCRLHNARTREACRVLNAFRHQGKNHLRASARRTPAPAAGAQRLSASRQESRSFEVIQGAPPMCSTPFGIKARITWAECRGVGGRGRVLNAFRHQGKNHGDVTLQRRASARVLNAFRHQGKNHGAHGQEPEAVGLCSTPFGIKARITQGRTTACRCSCVLNAFRHQGKNHTCAKSLTKRSISAQRLSASRQESPGAQ